MLKLKPVLKNYLWGGKKFYSMYGRDNNGDKIAESWEVSIHPDGLSMGDNCTLADYIKQNPTSIDRQGLSFPILIKYIDACQNLSVQVHPNDEYGRRVENDNGKTEMWFIVDCDKGAGIYCGFKKDTNKEEFLAKVQDGTVEELLNFIPVKKGDCFLIEAGTVHAIGAGCVICEIQQSSNVTYRVYDYNRRGADGKLRQLHVDKAVEVINFNKYQDRTNSKAKEKFNGGTIQTLTECKYFCCRKLELNGKYIEQNENSFTAVNILDGQGTVNGREFKAGDSFFIDCNEKFEIQGKATVMLSSKSNQEYYAGVDIGGTFVKAGIVDSYGRILVKDKIPTKSTYKEVAKSISEFVLELAKKEEIKLAGVGIGCAGAIDSENGVVVYSNNLGWTNCEIKKDVEEQTKLKVFVSNDANVACLGECAYGSGKNFKDVILITIGTGIGSGIVIDGKLFEGNKGAGAEVGHSVIKMNGEKCTCGRKGCLEAYASTSALVKQAKTEMSKNQDSLLWKLCENDVDKLDGVKIVKAVKENDKTAKKVFNRYIKYLACGLVNISNEFRPQAIILGGGISATREMLTKPLQRILNKEIFGGNSRAPIKILTATLENDAGILGATKLI